MIIIFATDLHGQKHLYEALFNLAKEKKADIILFGGDLGPKAFGSIERLIEVQQQFYQEFLLPSCARFKNPIGFIAGNDDARKVIESLSCPSNMHYLHKKVVKIGNILVGGYSFTNRLPFRLKDWEKPEIDEPPLTDPYYDIRSVAAESGSLQEDFRILEEKYKVADAIWVIHVPPYNTNLDMIHDYRHVGSKVVRKFIEKNQPLLTLHGHIHESPKMSGNYFHLIGKTICINPGSNPFQQLAWAVWINTETFAHERILLEVQE